VSVYWMSLRKEEYPGVLKKNWLALCGELTLEEA
jgi:hypothetical protein